MTAVALIIGIALFVTFVLSRGERGGS